MSNWITSDTHAFHANICRGTSKWDSGYRDFDTIEEMTETIANNINAVAQPKENLEIFLILLYRFGMVKLKDNISS